MTKIMKRKLDAKSAPNLPPLADAQAFIKSRPWDHLKGRFCPVGRGKVAEAREAERCAGRVGLIPLFLPCIIPNVSLLACSPFNLPMTIPLALSR